jgi:hypothetical protein
MRLCTFSVLLSLFSISSYGQISSDSTAKLDSLVAIIPSDTGKLCFRTVWESHPQFNDEENLDQYLAHHLKKIKKPNSYRKTGLCYEVKVIFIIEKDGAISGVSLGAYAKELDELSRQKIIETFENNA